MVGISLEAFNLKYRNRETPPQYYAICTHQQFEVIAQTPAKKLLHPGAPLTKIFIEEKPNISDELPLNVQGICALAAFHQCRLLAQSLDGHGPPLTKDQIQNLNPNCTGVAVIKKRLSNGSDSFGVYEVEPILQTDPIHPET